MILTESNFSNIITESSEDGKKLYLAGVFMESETRNRNGRIYKREEIAEAVNKANRMAANGQYLLGELDHPSTLEVKLENVSHKIVQMEMRGTQAIGKAEILSLHPKGKILEALIKSGVNVGVSSRGAGSVDSEGIVEGFDMVTIDAVATPSAQNAYPQSITEALELYKKGGIITDLSEAVLHDKAAQKYFEKEIKKFLADMWK